MLMRRFAHLLRHVAVQFARFHCRQVWQWIPDPIAIARTRSFDPATALRPFGLPTLRGPTRATAAYGEPAIARILRIPLPFGKPEGLCYKRYGARQYREQC